MKEIFQKIEFECEKRVTSVGLKVSFFSSVQKSSYSPLETKSFLHYNGNI